MATEAPDMLSALPDALLLRIFTVVGHGSAKENKEAAWFPQHLCRLRAVSRCAPALRRAGRS